MTEDKQTAAAQYRVLMASRAPDIVKVTAPSGFVFKFRAQTAFNLIFEDDQLPTAQASEAIEQWEKDGVATKTERQKLLDKRRTLIGELREIERQIKEAS